MFNDKYHPTLVLHTGQIFTSSFIKNPIQKSGKNITSKTAKTIHPALEIFLPIELYNHFLNSAMIAAKMKVEVEGNSAVVLHFRETA